MSQTNDTQTALLQACFRFLLHPGLDPAQKLQLAACVNQPQEATASHPPPGVSVTRAQWARWLAPLGRVEMAAKVTRNWLSADVRRSIVSFWDAAYPAGLRALPRPPWLLLVEGVLPPAGQPAMAIVGSRSASRAGLRHAREFSRELAARGWLIVSGMARGIDGAAHQGALDAGAATVAVLGCGIDVTYPPEHARLRQAIIDGGGAIVSEYPPGTPPHSGFFPSRNRIIAGWIRGVLVVEAATRSGSLITAHQANELGRCVMAMPGSTDSPLARGCHQMIRAGASLVETVDDVLEDLLGPSAQAELPGLAAAPKQRRRPRSPLSPAQPETLRTESSPSVCSPSAEIPEAARQLLAAFAGKPRQFDELSDELNWPAGELSGLLTELEMAGCLEPRPGLWWAPT